MKPDFTLWFNQYQLHFQLADNPVANKWLLLLEQKIKQHSIKSRFVNFSGSNPEFFSSQINSHLQIINKYYPVDVSVDPTSNQEILNYLHDLFVRLRGETYIPNKLYLKYPQEYKDAVEELNILIHQWESFTKACPYVLAGIWPEEQNTRIPLEDSDYEHFTMHHNFGDIVLDYCQVGKHLYETFLDDDDIIEDISPQKYISPKFMLFLFQSCKKRKQSNFDEWCKRKANYLVAKNINLLDKKTAIGFIPLANLLSSSDRASIIDSVDENQIISRIEIH